MVADPEKTRDWWPSLDNMRLDRSAVIVLNTNIYNPPKLVGRLWNECEWFFFFFLSEIVIVFGVEMQTRKKIPSRR